MTLLHTTHTFLPSFSLIKYQTCHFLSFIFIPSVLAMVKKQVHQQRVSSPAFADEVPPKPLRTQPSFLVDSVVQKMLSNTTIPTANRASGSQASYASTSFMPSYKQADLKSNRGLKGKSRAISVQASHNDSALGKVSSSWFIVVESKCKPHSS